MNASYSIESNVKLIAAVGAILFATLIGALFVVQHSLGATQTKLSETVVPIQQQLAKIAGAEGAMFRRQGEIVAANDLSINAIGSRDHHEDKIREGATLFRMLVVSTGPHQRKRIFPASEANALESEIEVFLNADDELYEASIRFQELSRQFASSIDTIEKDLRSVIEASSGLAGVLRLEHVSQLRQLAQKAVGSSVDSSLLRPMIMGSARLQLDTISQLDAAVLRLGVLAGKVGLATNEDALNSLAANELIQNRDQITQTLAQLEKLVEDSELAVRLQSLKTAVVELAKSVGDESILDSLASLHRRKLQEEQRVYQSQLAMSRYSEQLEASTEKLHDYLQEVANQAKSSAAITIQRSRQVTISISLGTLVLGMIAASRIRASVIGLRMQNQQLSELSDALTKTNQGLEQSVAARTASLQLVLDSTGDGLLVVDLDGRLLPERSKAVANWFGVSERGVSVWDYLAADSATKDSMQLAFEQMADDILPFCVSSDQAPKRLHRNGRTYQLEYKAVYEEARLARTLLSLHDITSELAAEQAETQMRELHILVGNLLRDRNGFEQTIDECSALLAELVATNDLVITKRHLHTLKGNLSTVGFFSVAKVAHDLESRLVDEDRKLVADEVRELECCWQASLSNIGAYLSTKRENIVEVSTDELDKLRTLLLQRTNHDELIREIDMWKNEPTHLPLSRLAEQARQLAQRLGKNVQVTTECNRLRIPADHLQRFWMSMVHTVRNAIDHGIEPPEERVRLGKSETASLQLTTRQVGSCYEIEVVDDGRGIDWERLRQVGVKRGLRCETEADLVEALFSDGVTTRSKATEVSGRGIGLSAVRNECERAGGCVQVYSRAGAGTRFVFQFPVLSEALPSKAIVFDLNSSANATNLAGKS